MTTRAEFAEVLERFASEVIQLPGVSRVNPHVFAERKDELMKAMMAQARELRTRDPRGMPQPAIDVGTIAPGLRRIGDREVPVERRGRRA